MTSPEVREALRAEAAKLIGAPRFDGLSMPIGDEIDLTRALGRRASGDPEKARIAGVLDHLTTAAPRSII